jgi:hypothetical protein
VPTFELCREGGYATFRSRDGRDRLLFDCGGLGYPPHASHGHADLLGILADVDGEEMLIDPGTFAYWDPDGRRNLFRSTAMHNTVEIGGRDQADPFDPFKWLNIPNAGIDHVAHETGLAYVEAWHDGYTRLRPSVVHRRAVLAIAGGWLVVDWLDGRGAHQITRWLHASPRCRLARTATGVDVVSDVTGNALRIADVGWHHDAARLEVGNAPYSERYGESSDAPTAAFSEVATLPAVRALLLLPVRSGDAPRLAVETRRATPDAAWIVLREADGTEWSVALRDVAAATRVGDLVIDARAAVMQRSSGSRQPEIHVLGGRQAQLLTDA